MNFDDFFKWNCQLKISVKTKSHRQRKPSNLIEVCFSNSEIYHLSFWISRPLTVQYSLFICILVHTGAFLKKMFMQCCFGWWKPILVSESSFRKSLIFNNCFLFWPLLVRQCILNYVWRFWKRKVDSILSLKAMLTENSLIHKWRWYATNNPTAL